jgi:arabinogalactan endo-1,4-beta-galactosidase
MEQVLELKDLLENMKAALTTIVNAKISSLENIKNDFINLANTAETMELEKTILENLNKANNSEEAQTIIKEATERLHIITGQTPNGRTN